MSQDNDMVICVSEESRHTDDSLLVKCTNCDTKVWVSPHHLVAQRKPICLTCMSKILLQAKEKNEKIDVNILPEDMNRVIEEIRKEVKRNADFPN